MIHCIYGIVIISLTQFLNFSIFILYFIRCTILFLTHVFHDERFLFGNRKIILSMSNNLHDSYVLAERKKWPFAFIDSALNISLSLIHLALSLSFSRSISFLFKIISRTLTELMCNINIILTPFLNVCK